MIGEAATIGSWPNRTGHRAAARSEIGIQQAHLYNARTDGHNVSQHTPTSSGGAVCHFSGSFGRFVCGYEQPRCCIPESGRGPGVGEPGRGPGAAPAGRTAGHDRLRLQVQGTHMAGSEDRDGAPVECRDPAHTQPLRRGDKDRVAQARSVFGSLGHECRRAHEISLGR